jgi:hypothetical protein
VSVLYPPEADDPRRDAKRPRTSRAFAEPTPGIEPGTPSLRETPGANSGEQPGLLATTDPLQMQLFDLDPEEQP